MDMVKIGVYRHTKTGKKYQVIGIAKHSETLEDLVIYKCLYTNPTSMYWVRPMTMFTENVQIHGSMVPRFTFVKE